MRSALAGLVLLVAFAAGVCAAATLASSLVAGLPGVVR